MTQDRPSGSTLAEQIAAVKRIIAESRGAVFNPLSEDDRDALRYVLATLEGMAAPASDLEIFEGPPLSPEQIEGMRAWALASARQNAAELLSGDSPSPQQPTQEARPYQADARRVAAAILAAHDDSDDPSMDKLELAFSHALESFAAQRVTTAPVSQTLLQRAEQLWKDLQENNLGGFSGINRPFWIVQAFKEVENAAIDKARREAQAEIERRYDTLWNARAAELPDAITEALMAGMTEMFNEVTAALTTPQNPGDAAPEE